MDFNFEDYENNKGDESNYQNPWLGLRQQYVDLVAAGFTSEEAMQIVLHILNFQLRAFNASGVSDNNS